MLARKSQGEALVEDFARIFARLPWWLPPFFIPLPFLIITRAAEGKATIEPLAAPFGWLFSALVAMAVIGGWITKLKRRHLVAKTSSIQSVKGLPWQRFEELVAEAYKKHGYNVKLTGKVSSDGGVDVELRRDGELTLVQCKHWRHQVGVERVRELLGVVSARGATQGILMATEGFTAAAKAFAETTPIELIDGKGLVRLLADGIGKPIEDPVPDSSKSTSINCPNCGSGMVLRTARKGANAGKDFWGCPRYPTCRGIRQVDPPATA